MLLSKQEQIQATALRLFVADGFHGTPTAKIAAEAGVANGTLFYHYKTKDDLVVALYNKIQDEHAANLQTIINQNDFISIKFRNIFIHSVNWALGNRDKFYYIQQFKFSPHLSQVSAETLEQHTIGYSAFIAEGIRKKLLKQQPVSLIISMFNGHVYGVYQYLISNDFDPSEKEKIINDGYEMLWDMLKYM
ncbi:TetR/AcrR family transcriptional regulator [Mucilaginibacter sp. dw_454]|uniref:TetR/AcrR family transcriptional regulator n=1 Tax=Mucilaginibacter sp. dw_454 TaxID=2720079 RepID=UPI001BD2BC06|nr:TetR/AcrR family transcriptional regulator [Mucilaginibacter sp. dw_454]